VAGKKENSDHIYYSVFCSFLSSCGPGIRNEVRTAFQKQKKKTAEVVDLSSGLMPCLGHVRNFGDTLTCGGHSASSRGLLVSPSEPHNCHSNLRFSCMRN
jgi:hypothetical protein